MFQAKGPVPGGTGTHGSTCAGPPATPVGTCASPGPEVSLRPLLSGATVGDGQEQVDVGGSPECH